MAILRRFIPLVCGLLFTLYSHAAEQVEKIEKTQAAYSGINFFHSALKALCAIAVFLIAWKLVGRAAKSTRLRITKLTVSKLPKISLGRVSILDPKRVSIWLKAIVRLIHYSIVAVLAYLCIIYILNCFPYTQPWAGTLGSGLANLLIKLGETVLQSIPGLFAIAVIVFATKGLAHLINSIFRVVERGEAEIPWIHKDIVGPTRRIVIVLLWLFAIVMAYPYIPGNESIAFRSVGVFFGLLVSFGSAGVVNQVMNGFVIMFARSFKRGDYVKIGDVEGTVSELSMLTTKLHTMQHEEIIIPNSVVVAQTTYNYTRIASEHGAGISTLVGVGYDTPWRQVHALLMMAAENTKGLGKDPAPYVIQTALSDSCVEYTLVVHMTEKPNMRQFVRSDLHKNIQDIFNQYGIQMTSPTYIVSGVPSAVPAERLYMAPAKKDMPL